MTSHTDSKKSAAPVIDAKPVGHRRRRRHAVAPLTRRRQPSSATVLLVAAFGAFLAFLDSTIVNVAFPDIQRHFHSDISDLSWVLNAYNIVFAAFLVALGKLADLVGRKRVFIYGVVLFTVASGLCGIADSVGQLIAFRVLQGIGAAVLVPASLGLVVERFPAERRAHGVNLWGAAGAIASGLGPPVGGALVEALSWRWVFLVNVPLGVLVVLAARRALVESRAAGRRRMPDVRGAALLAIALGLLTLGLIKGPDWGWASLRATGSLVAAAVVMVGFVMSSRLHPAPLVEPALLRIRTFVAGSGLTAIASAGFYAYLLVHILFLNYVWGYSLLRAGMAVAPAAFVAAVVAALLGRVADRHGYRAIIAIGGLIWAASLLWYLEFVGSTPNFLGEWLPGQILQGIGVGATFPLLGSAALAELAAGGSYATASAVVGTIRQVGAVIGIALLVILIGTPAPGAAEEALRRGWAMAAICFVAVAIGAVLLGRKPQVPAEAVEPKPAPLSDPLGSQPPVSPPAESVPSASSDVDVLEALRFVRLDAQQVELEAGSYLFHAGDVSDSLYVVQHGRLQVLSNDGVVTQLGRGQVVGELGVLLDAPRSATVRAVRDSSLLRVTKAEFEKIADASVLRALVGVLANRLRQKPLAPARKTTPEVVVAVIGADADAPIGMVATELCSALSTWLRAVAPGRVDRAGLDHAEQAADRVVLQAAVDDAQWRDCCLRVADRVVLVASTPAPPTAPLPARATGADLVLTGAPAGREHRRAWEQLITPRSTHAVRRHGYTDDLRPLAARIAGRSVGLVLSGGAARACAHLGVLEELEAAGVAVDRFAGTSMGAVIAGFAACGMDAAGVDAQVYEYFVRMSHGDYTLPSRGLIRGQRTQTAFRAAFGDRLVEELPKQFRCVSVDLLTRRPVVHRRGLLVDVINCSMRLPFLYAPMPYDGGLHVDGGVLANVPVTALAGSEGPVIAVSLTSSENESSAPDSNRRSNPRVPRLTDTLLRTMTISSAITSAAVLAQADVVIKPNPIGVGFMEYHQIDRAREAGRAATRAALPQIMELVHGSVSGVGR
ncbi:MFS transporter [Mycobacterium riyadhense]|uniref:MFS transporter n=1 Tax=Mycobacterium riyadhense TaxID=486698 RepID=UPI00195ECE3A|nr:MFS transporter [Mycobacterium riyadhense]